MKVAVGLCRPQKGLLATMNTDVSLNTQSHKGEEMICRMNLIHCEFANSNGYCERTACCNPNIVGNTIKYEEQKAYSQQCVDELKAKYGWHTGTPTEYGLYLVQYIHGGYDVVLFDPSASGWDIYTDDSPNDIVAWQKIEPYEASN